MDDVCRGKKVAKSIKSAPKRVARKKKREASSDDESEEVSIIKTMTN